MEVSAKEDINISAAFLQLARTIYDMQMAQAGESPQVPSTNSKDPNLRSISLHAGNAAQGGGRRSS